MMGYCIVAGGKPDMVAPAKSFAASSWDEIILACQKNAIPDSWVVGSQKNMTINGTDYAIDIIGKNHDDYSDGSGKAPLTFQLHDCYKTLYPMNNSTVSDLGYGNSTMRNTTLPNILKFMPEEIKDSIKPVNKFCATSNYTGTIVTISEKLFLLSEVETYGSVYRAWEGEGQQYDYYKAGNSKRKTSLTSGGNFVSYWSRSPYKYTSSAHFSDSYFAEVGTSNTDEVEANAAKITSNRNIAFAFCF